MQPICPSANVDKFPAPLKYMLYLDKPKCPQQLDIDSFFRINISVRLIFVLFKGRGNINSLPGLDGIA